jgi:toxin FitB
LTILIDSHGWIEYFADGPLAESYAPYVEKANAENTVTPAIVVYRKIRNAKGEQKALEAYAQMSCTRIADLTSILALKAADISIALSLGMADSIVLATAKEHDAQIITSDQHLKDVHGVKFIKK